MVNNIFRALYLIAFVCLIGVLFGIYQKMDNGRFQMTEHKVLDTQTGRIYPHDVASGGYLKFNKEKIQSSDYFEPLKITELPH